MVEMCIRDRLDIPHIKGVDEDGNEVERKTDDNEPFAALAFKIATDPFVGKLCFFRVYSGTLDAGSKMCIRDREYGKEVREQKEAKYMEQHQAKPKEKESQDKEER